MFNVEVFATLTAFKLCFDCRCPAQDVLWQEVLCRNQEAANDMEEVQSVRWERTNVFQIISL